MKHHNLKNNHDNQNFWITLLLLLLMVFIRYGFQIDFPRLLLLIPVLAIALQGNQTQIVTLIVCLIPLHESLDFYYALLISIVIYISKYYKRIKINLSAVLMMIMIAWELLHYFTEDFSLVSFVISLLPMLVLIVLMCSDLADADYSFLVRAMAVTLLSVAITMFIQLVWLARFNFAAAISNLRRLGSMDETSRLSLVVSGGMIQMNSLGILVVLTIAGILQVRNTGQKNRIDLFFISALLIFGALSASRTFLACLLMMALLMFMAQRNGLKKIRFLVAAVLACVLFLIVFGTLFPEQLEYFAKRFHSSDITTGRDDLMTAYHRFLSTNPMILVFGIGLQDYGPRLVNSYRVASTVPHNSIQEILIAWGVPGIVFFMVLMLMMIFVSRKQKRHHTLLNYIPLVIILFKSMAGQLLTSGYSMLALSYAYLSLCQNFKTKEVR